MRCIRVEGEIEMNFMTIREAAKHFNFPEYRLRVMRREGTLPGILNGNRFMINVDLLTEQFDKDSHANAVEKITIANLTKEGDGNKD